MSNFLNSIFKAFGLDSTKWGPATVLVVGLVLIVAVGAIVALIIGGTTWVRFLQLAGLAWKFAVASGLLGIGRGVNNGLSKVAHRSHDVHKHAA